MTLLAILVIAVGILAYRFDQPGEVPAVFFQVSPDWETSVDSPDIQREHVFIQSGKVKLEADLLIPVGGKEKKGAVIFITGSGPINQAYFGIPQKYVQGVFLPRDMAVLYVNKRGVGELQGNWKHQDFQGRADDLYAAVQFLKEHNEIDPDRIGIMGHSQGGYIVPMTASQHQDVAFFVSLVGPTTVVWEQMEDDYENGFRCQGYEGTELEKKVELIMKWDRIGAKIGKVIPLGEIGFQAGIFDYDPRQVLPSAKAPDCWSLQKMIPWCLPIKTWRASMKSSMANRLKIYKRSRSQRAPYVPTDGYVLDLRRRVVFRPAF